MTQKKWNVLQKGLPDCSEISQLLDFFKGD